MENVLNITAQRSYNGILVKLKHANATVLLAVRELYFIVFHLLNAINYSLFELRAFSFITDSCNHLVDYAREENY